MRRLSLIATALTLSTCAPPGYVYEPGNFLRPHPTAELCAAKNLVLDPATKDCVMPPPAAPTPPAPRRPAPPPKQAMPPPHAVTPAPTVADMDTAGPAIEPDATIKDDLRQNVKLLRELVHFVREQGFPCDSLSALQLLVEARRFKLACNHNRANYEIEGSEGHWTVRMR